MAQSNSELQLQRSSISFRRQGSSGAVWDDRHLSGKIAYPKHRSQPMFYSGELILPNKAQQLQHQQVRSRRNQQNDFNINPEVNVKPIKTTVGSNHQPDVVEPSSSRFKGCGCCGALGKSPRASRNVRPVRSRPR